LAIKLNGTLLAQDVILNFETRTIFFESKDIERMTETSLRAYWEIKKQEGYVYTSCCKRNMRNAIALFGLEI
jgi:hypothetical protein